MFLLVCSALVFSVARAAPGIFEELDLGALHAAPLDLGHALPAAPLDFGHALPAAPLDFGHALPAAPLDFGHALPAPILTPAVLKTAPIIAPAPIIKTVTPIVKQIAPATSYATVTQFHVTHPATVVKAVVAPPPILKTLALPATFALGHGDEYH